MFQCPNINKINLPYFSLLSQFDNNQNLLFSPVFFFKSMEILYQLCQNSNLREKLTLIMNEIKGENFSQLNNFSSNLSASYGLWINEDSFQKIPGIQAIFSNVDKYPNSFVDFLPENSVSKINKFIFDQTRSLILEAFSQEFFEKISYVIINPIFFQAKWKIPYKRSKTFAMKFQNFSESYKVDFMHHKNKFFYAEDELCQVLQLDYVQNFSLYLFLPKDLTPDGLKTVISSDLSSLSLKEETVMTQIPKFSIKAHTNLLPLFQTKPFDLIQNFIKSDENPFQEGYLSHFYQTMVFGCGEDGTESGSSTMRQECCTYEPNLKHFNANHPFAYSLMDNNKNILLKKFIGLI